jgi:uncharacterized repeat protein (TIGR03803 family)
MTARLKPAIWLAIGLSLAVPLQQSAAGTLATLYSFPNPNATPFMPEGGLTAVGGVLYGTTYEGGAGGRGSIIAVSAKTGKVRVVASFTGTNGANPNGGLTHVGGDLYGTTYSGGTNGLGTVFKVALSTGALTSLYSFDGKSGKNPGGSLIFSSGSLYGVSTYGGRANLGAVFKVNPGTGAEKVLYSFSGSTAGTLPSGGLAIVSGIIYGTTSVGGSSGNGTIFSIDPATETLTTLYSFMGGTDGAYPLAPLIAGGGTLYGTTEGAPPGSGELAGGTVFKFTPATGAATTLHYFPYDTTGDGYAPMTSLILDNGVLYGTTPYGGAVGGGTVFAVNATTGAESVLGSLSTVPFAPVTLIGSTLYGTTIGLNQSGPETGLETGGTVFDVSITGGAITNLGSFGGANPGNDNTSSLIALKGALIGTTAQGGPAAAGAAFTLDPSTNTVATLANLGSGSLPYGGLINVGGTLFGTTQDGGTGNGSVFSLDPATGATKTLYAFTEGNDGGQPKAGLLANAGSLYGTAEFGGEIFGGTVFQVDVATGAQTTLHAFGGSGSDGLLPNAGLIKVGPLLYGTTTYGGNGFAGVVYSLDPQTQVETIVHAFTGAGSPLTSDGAYPAAGLTEIGGVLYGTTVNGGSYAGVCAQFGCGTLYTINAATGAETVLHTFTGGLDGAYPQGVPIKVGSHLYATTGGGGAHGGGALIAINPATGTVTTLYSFLGIADGAYPASALLNDGGAFYGTTNNGGTGNAGTVFRFTP